MDEVPRTVAELAELVGISNTYCFTLLEGMAEEGAISLRKSIGTWIAWRHNKRLECTSHPGKMQEQGPGRPGADADEIDKDTREEKDEN